MRACTHCDSWQVADGSCTTCGLAASDTPRTDADMMRAACLALVRTINATGGITASGEPVADEEWSDLGEAYVMACAALGFKAKESGASSRGYTVDDGTCSAWLGAVLNEVEGGF